VPLQVHLEENLQRQYRSRIAMLIGAGLVVLIAILSLFLWKRKQAADVIHKANEDLKHAHDDLIRAHHRLALKHEIARMGAFEWFVPQERVAWSPEMEEIFGIHSTDHVHTLEEWKSLVHPADLAEAMGGLQSTAKHKLPTFDDTYRIIRPDGQTRWIHARRKYQYDSDGKPLYVMGICMDVTDLKQGEMAQQILGGLVQVCSACRRIHEHDQWYSMEGYLRLHGTAKFSHGMCPDCSKQWLEEKGPRLVKGA